MVDNNKTYLSTPVGKSGFASVTREGKFQNYNVQLVLPNNEETEKFIKELNEIHQANLDYETATNGEGNPAAAPKAFTPIDDSKVPDQFKGGDHVVFTFSTKSRNKNGDLLSPPTLYDAKGNTVNLDHELPIGSTIRLRLGLYSYNYNKKYGTSTRIHGVQIGSMPERERRGVEPMEGDFIGVGPTDLNLDDLMS